MRYEIFGGNLPAVQIDLAPGESIYTQSGGMTWMTDGIRMETNLKGGVMGGLGRMLTGESAFRATFTAEQNAQITVASTFPGQILLLEVGPQKQYIAQKSAFLCATEGVDTSVETVRAGGAFFGGEGWLLQRICGQGLVFLEIDGSMREYDLKPGERMKVDTGNVAAYEASVSYTVERVKGFKNIMFGGEGLFLTTLTGPGKVWLQTMTIKELAGRLIPFLPAKN